jgi:DNA-binding HxlR family transcriptional regulator
MSKCKSANRSTCPISYSLDLFGDRWTMLVLRDIIMHGKKRYGEMLSSAEGIASNILSDRLKRLEADGIVSRETDPQDGRQVIYRATAKGESLVPLLLEMAAWGASQDSNTGAPRGFAEGYYADRENYYLHHQRLIQELFEQQQPDQLDG